jgi:hypothetical protein
MSARTALRGVSLAACLAMSLLLLIAGGAFAAAAVKVCVPEKEGKSIVTPIKGACKKGFRLAKLGTEGKEGKQGAQGMLGPEGKQGAEGKVGAEGKEGKQGAEGKAGLSGLSGEEQTTLEAILPDIKYVPAGGVPAKPPTIQFSGVNVQVINGEGKTATANGAGNVIIGYDELSVSRVTEQTGSHNLVLGTGQSYSSWGAILGGEENTSSGPYGDVFGDLNSVSGVATSVTGGEQNRASETASLVSGGFKNKAAFGFSSMLGGKALETKTEYEPLL